MGCDVSDEAEPVPHAKRIAELIGADKGTARRWIQPLEKEYVDTVIDPRVREETENHGEQVSEEIEDVSPRKLANIRQDDETSDAAAVRQCIERSQRLDDAEQTVADLEVEVERLKEEKRLILEERDEKRELAIYAEAQRTRQQRKDEAGIFTRTKWFLVGMDRR